MKEQKREIRESNIDMFLKALDVKRWKEKRRVGRDLWSQPTLLRESCF